MWYTLDHVILQKHKTFSYKRLVKLTIIYSHRNNAITSTPLRIGYYGIQFVNILHCVRSSSFHIQKFLIKSHGRSVTLLAVISDCNGTRRASHRETQWEWEKEIRLFYQRRTANLPRRDSQASNYANVIVDWFFHKEFIKRRVDNLIVCKNTDCVITQINQLFVKFSNPLLSIIFVYTELDMS